jgi:hypothetical protein
MIKLTDEQFARLSTFAESVHKLPDKFVDTNLILSVLIIQALLIGVCTLYLKNLIYQTLIPPAILELIK